MITGAIVFAMILAAVAGVITALWVSLSRWEDTDSDEDYYDPFREQPWRP